MKWLSQFLQSYQLMIANVSPHGTSKGAIVASVSKDSPNYWYSWTRDSALTMNVLRVFQCFQYSNPEFKIDTQSQAQLDLFFDNYANFTHQNQLTKTMSADINNSSLGEPKFNVDGSAYNYPWGRPQNDGPALRSFAMIKYLQQSKRTTNWYTKGSGSIIKTDCEYVAHKVNDLSFDLWEEVLGNHFYNAVVYDKALQACSEIAHSQSDHGAAYYYSAKRLDAHSNIKKHLNSTFVMQTINAADNHNKNSNLDIATVLAIIQLNCSLDDQVYASHPKVQSTVAQLQHRFKKIYPINSNKSPGVAYGRYPEDVYNGIDSSGNANPWFLTTLAVAEYFYFLILEYSKLQYVEISSVNKDFFNSNGLQLDDQIIRSEDPQFRTILNKLFKLGDDQIERAVAHGSMGHLSEQFNSKTGFMQGAQDLTWSYASYITAAIKRAEAAKVLDIDANLNELDRQEEFSIMGNKV